MNELKENIEKGQVVATIENPEFVQAKFSRLHGKQQ